jgi:hypothetical protein
MKTSSVLEGRGRWHRDDASLSMSLTEKQRLPMQVDYVLINIEYSILLNVFV